MEPNLQVLREGDLDHGFAGLVRSYPGAGKILGCIQCGTCTGSCQLAQDMDYTPRRIIEMVRAGLKDEVLSSKAIWYCASCYSCTVRCPKDIKVTEVMYALRALSLRRRRSRSVGLSPVFYSTFSRLVNTLGKMYEAGLIVLVALRSNPFRLVKLAPVGGRMFFQGKLGLLPKRVAGRAEIQKMLAKTAALQAEALEARQSPGGGGVIDATGDAGAHDGARLHGRAIPGSLETGVLP